KEFAKIAKIERENEDCLRALCDILAHFAVKALNRQGREEFAKIAKKGEHNGNPNHNITSARSSTDGSVASCIHAVVAGSGAILSPAHARSGRHRLACCVLACDRFGLWQLVPLRWFSRPAALSRLLLSRRADHDCVVHFNLYHDVGDRRPQRRLSALGAGRAGSPLRDRSGQSFGGTTLSTIQGLIFLAFAPLVGVHVSPGDFLLVALTVFLVSFALTALGFAIAWPMDSTQAFHAIINLFLIPLWLLSGALFPLAGASGWIRLL